MNKKFKRNKGITLIALIITIIVLLILAVVAIRTVQGDRILAYATNASKLYTKEEEEENQTLKNYIDYIIKNKGDPESPAETLEEAQTDEMYYKTVNSKVTDEYGNQIVVPAGFKITKDATHVTEGIVIQDEAGNEFVWIPVGTIYTDKEKTDKNSQKITLGRYTFDVKFSGGRLDQANSTCEATIVQPTEDKTYEDTVATTDPILMAQDKNDTFTENSKNEFTTSANNNGGYYLGRYEARTTNPTVREASDALTEVTCKKENAVYNYIKQSEALTKSQEMYSGKTFKSDLINSYAWDTATVFIQIFGTNSKYAIQRSLNNTFSNTGTTIDIQCNIYDMASNCDEWTTETCSDEGHPCTRRGGGWYYQSGYMCSRFGNQTGGRWVSTSFRTILYV